MNWKNHLKLILLGLLWYALIILSLYVFSVFNPLLSNLSISGLLEKLRVVDIIALITIIAITTGSLIYLGFSIGLHGNYRLIRVGFGFKQFISFSGSIILLGTVLLVLSLVSKQPYSVVVALYMLLLILMGYVLGKLTGQLKINEKVTLKMVVKDAAGNTRLRMKHDLELYETTDQDYRFKDFKTGNEFIIPIGQVQEIIYETHWSKNMSKLKKDEEKILYHIYKKRYMVNYRPFRISDLLSEFISEYNANDIINIINSLVSQGFIVVKTNGIALQVDAAQRFLTGNPEVVERIPLELCAPNVEKITEIKKLLRYRRGINWIKENFILTWQFVWKHFIVTIIVSALTTYIITKYITHS